MIESFSGHYAFLSNFHQAPMVVQVNDLVPLRVPDLEHAFQALKTLNEAEREWVLAAPTAAEAKRRGKKVTLRPDWDAAKREIMYRLVWAKFSQHPELAHKLEETGDQPLVEGNTWGDHYWGVCRGAGENHLGKILMRVRRELRAADDIDPG